MIKKKWAVWVVVLIAVGVVTASTLTTLEPGTLSDKNISFASAGSNTNYHFELPNTSTVSSATMNVTGYENITVSFNFTEDSSPITTNVTIDNITIGGEVCEILPV